jgi:uncharacterized protein YktB (UPF0637 family)
LCIKNEKKCYTNVSDRVNKEKNKIEKMLHKCYTNVSDHVNKEKQDRKNVSALFFKMQMKQLYNVIYTFFVIVLKITRREFDFYWRFGFIIEQHK